jgi:hypothetical protein
VKEILENFLKEKMGESILTIRYFNGTDKFSDNFGRYSSDSLEESIKLYIKQNEKKN